MQIKNVKFISMSCIILILVAYTGLRYVVKLPAIKGTVSGSVSWNTERTAVPTRAGIEINRKHMPYDVILNTYMRSGSTITGKILSKRPDTFYLFEPLWKVAKQSLYKGPDLFCEYSRPNCINLTESNFERNSGEVDNTDTNRGLKESLNFLQSVFNCSFHTYSHYFVDSGIQTLQKREHDWTFYKGYGWGAYKICRDNKQNSLTNCLKKAEPSCKSAKHRVVKLLRMTLDNLETMLLRNDRLKVIHLFRDPRGILNSQLHTSWFPVEGDDEESVAKNIKVMCERLLLDLQTGKRLQMDFPDRVKLIQYERLANLTDVAENLYAFLGMSYSAEQEKVVQKLAAPKKTSKGTKGFHPFNYRLTLSWNIVRTLDTECAMFLDRLGYVRYQSESHLRDMSQPGFVSSLH